MISDRVVTRPPCPAYIDAKSDVALLQLEFTRRAMRTTVTIDDTLYEKALEAADPSMDKADLIREALETFVSVQTAKRLAALGGRQPDPQQIPRRKAEAGQGTEGNGVR